MLVGECQERCVQIIVTTVIRLSSSFRFLFWGLGFVWMDLVWCAAPRGRASVVEGESCLDVNPKNGVLTSKRKKYPQVFMKLFES